VGPAFAEAGSRIDLDQCTVRSDLGSMSFFSKMLGGKKGDDKAQPYTPPRPDISGSSVPGSSVSSEAEELWLSDVAGPVPPSALSRINAAAAATNSPSGTLLPANFAQENPVPPEVFLANLGGPVADTDTSNDEALARALAASFASGAPSPRGSSLSEIAASTPPSVSAAATARHPPERPREAPGSVPRGAAANPPLQFQAPPAVQSPAPPALPFLAAAPQISTPGVTAAALPSLVPSAPARTALSPPAPSHPQSPEARPTLKAFVRRSRAEG